MSQATNGLKFSFELTDVGDVVAMWSDGDVSLCWLDDKGMLNISKKRMDSNKLDTVLVNNPNCIMQYKMLVQRGLQLNASKKEG